MTILDFRFLEFPVISNRILNLEPLIWSGFASEPFYILWPLFRFRLQTLAVLFQMSLYSGILFYVRTSASKNYP